MWSRFVAGLSVCVVLSLTACGDDATGASVGSAADSLVTPDVQLLPSGDAGGDVATTDTDQDDAGASIDVAASDAGGDVATENECPGGPECACEGNTDCDNGICIETAIGKECARGCVDQCKEGYTCAPFSMQGGDNVLICAPTWDWACDPCNSSAQCKKVGLEGAVCVDYGDDGGYCGVPCSDESTCPVGYACKQVQSVEGAASKQCVRKGGEPFGTCSCSDAAIAKKLSTTCAIAHKDDKGQVTATCEGVRSCADKGLTKCIGPAPSAELCDGVDNDCDGQTDELACEDNNQCTADACDAKGGTDGKGACKHVQLDGACDADGSQCTESDKCSDGLCVPGPSKNCDDGNACTLDACAPSSGCTKTVDDGTTCDADGNPCTVGDVCVAGACKVGKAKVCDSADACILGKCLASTGKCAFANKNDKTPCDDGNLCTSSDVCAQGFCKGAPVNCDDSNPCTADSCVDKSGCAHAALANKCDDGNACTDFDKCSAGKCVGLPRPATACSDGNPCTKDGCDAGVVGKPGKGCVSTPADGLPCDDGQVCTQGDFCKAGQCAAGVFSCDCKIDADCKAKGDGNACNGTLACDKTGVKPTCKLDPATVVSCSKPDKPCLLAQCDKQSGKCSLSPSNPGTSCDDGDACTTADACVGGTVSDVACKGAQAMNCDDNNPCTHDTCDPKTGCKTSLNKGYSQPCYSGLPATKGVGVCKAGAKTCKPDATVGPCVGEVTPNQSELCDGKDDDCDGSTDEGCGTAGWSFTQVGARLSGQGANFGFDSTAGAQLGGVSSSAAQRTIHWGPRAWLQAWSGK